MNTFQDDELCNCGHRHITSGGQHLWPVIKVHRLKIRPPSSTICLSKVCLNAIFHREHFIIIDPLRKKSDPTIPGKLYCRDVKKP